MKKSILIILILSLFASFLPVIQPQLSVQAADTIPISKDDFEIKSVIKYEDMGTIIPSELGGNPIIEFESYDGAKVKRYFMEGFTAIWRHSDSMWTHTAGTNSIFRELDSLEHVAYYTGADGQPNYSKTGNYKSDGGNSVRCTGVQNEWLTGAMPSETMYAVEYLPKEIAKILNTGGKIKAVVYPLNREGNISTLAYTPTNSIQISDVKKIADKYTYKISWNNDLVTPDSTKMLIEHFSNPKDTGGDLWFDLTPTVGEFHNVNACFSLYGSGVSAKAAYQSSFNIGLINAETGKINDGSGLAVGSGTYDAGGAMGLMVVNAFAIAFYEDITPTQVIKVYEEQDGTKVTHEKTTIDDIDKDDEVYSINSEGDYEVEEWFATEKAKPDSITTSSTWESVSSITPKDESGSGQGTVTLNDPEKPVKAIYIRYVKKKPQPPGEGDIVLTEKRISRRFSLSESVKAILERTATVKTMFNIHHEELCYDVYKTVTSSYTGSDGKTYTSSYSVYDYTKHIYCKFGRWTDNVFKLVFQNPSSISHVAKANIYSPLEGDGLFGLKYYNNTLSGNAVGSPHTTDKVKPEFDFVVFREDQLPTIATYSYAVDKSKVIAPASTELAQLGVTQANKPVALKQKLTYNKMLNFNIDMSRQIDGRKLELTALCDKNVHTEKPSYQSTAIAYNINLLIQKFNDGENKGVAKSTALPNPSTTINGKTIEHLISGVVNAADNENLSFYPYVEMAYDTLKSTSTKVNVLADSLSTYKPNDYVEYGWTNSKPDDSLIIYSTQWSTHSKAVNGGGWHQKDRVLPGGAIFSATHNPTAKTTIGLTSWQTYVEDETRTALVGSDPTYATFSKYVLADKSTHHQSIIDNLKSEIEKLGLQMWANTNPTSSPYSGQKVSSGSTFNNKKLGIDKKYWFQKDTSGTSTKNTEDDFDVISGSEKTQKTYYRMRATVDGQIFLEKQGPIAGNPSPTAWGTLQSWAKTQTTPPSLSGEAKELDDRTKLVSNFFQSLDRNKGADADFGGTWYNEAFVGICVLKSETTFDIGFEKPAERKSAIDPYLEPARTSTSDYFTKAHSIGIKTELKTIRVDFGTLTTRSNTVLKDVEDVYKSKPFYLPNFTVSDSVN